MMTRRELAWVAARLGNLDASESAYRELIRPAPCSSARIIPTP